MADNPQPENVDEHQEDQEDQEDQENAVEPLAPHRQQNAEAPEQGQVAEPRPQLVNVREVILPPQPPVNGIIQIPNGPGNHHVLLFLEENLGRYANLADLIGRNNEQAIDMGEIRDLLNAVDLDEAEERADNNGERRENPANEAPPEDKHDDSDGSGSDGSGSDGSGSDGSGSDDDGEESGPVAMGHVMYIGRIENN